MKKRIAALAVLLAVSACGAIQPLDFTLNATPARSLSLNGTWKIAKDSENAGKAAEWFRRGPIDGAVDAQVPNPLELTFPGYDGVVWYWRTFDSGDLAKYDDVRLHFQGADYFAEAWLNGEYVGGNESALLPFAFDLKRAIRPGANNVVVRVIDASYAKEIDGFQLGNVPGGRQHDNAWEPGFRHQNYGGLLLPVTVEAFLRPWIADAFIRPDIAKSRIDVDLILTGAAPGEWNAVVRPAAPRAGAPVAKEPVIITPDGRGRATIALNIPHPHLWQVWDGKLYELQLTPKTGGTTWRGRFGMREISVASGRIAINGKQILQRSYLYNQIWPVTLAVPYGDLARRDMELVRKTNANMLRCFSKTPIPATVEAADEAGILLQPESLASWYLKTGPQQNERLRNVTERAVLLYRNHPSILWWNVLNENSPTMDPKRPYPANEFTLGPYTLETVLPAVHALDPTRPVIGNDPIWRDVKNIFEPGQNAPTLPLIQDHYYQFTALEIHPDSWVKIREREWGQSENASAPYLAITEWGLNSAPEWDRLVQSYKASGVRQDAEDFVAYRKQLDMNRRWYEEAGIAKQGFPTFESVENATRDAVAWHYHEHFALFWGNTHSAGQGLTSFDDSSYELSGVVDNWRNPKPVVFETITELNRPLQVNVWLRPSAVYAGDAISYDATLVNEGQRLSPGTYRLTVSLLDSGRRAARKMEYSYTVKGDLIERLVTASIIPDVTAGSYTLEVALQGLGQTLAGGRPVEVFERKPRALGTSASVWVWEKQNVLRDWLAKRSLQAKTGDATAARAGDIMLVVDADGADAAKKLQEAVRRGARAVFFQPEAVFSAGPKPRGTVGGQSLSDLLEPVAQNWKPELREISWWGNPGAWGYGRTALALRHSYLNGLPQAVALEAQPVYQRVAPQYTWVLTGKPEALPLDRAVVESNLEVDMPYTSDLFAMPFGEGRIVLTTLHIAEHLNADPAADRILENVIDSLR